jgi:hypothetical protein
VSDGQVPDLSRLDRMLERLDRTLHGGPGQKGLAFVVEDLVTQVTALHGDIHGKNGIAIKVHDHAQTLSTLRKVGWAILTVVLVQFAGLLVWMGMVVVKTGLG